ncbi:hypothetical protein SAMN05660489_02428 [Pseudomonas sp. LAMO17WK12:I10]|uniref:hypothetical protein n=1 Tax=unclassified Pseudomonas TaxID=196821 RepID=UPI000BD9B25F|nr:MULTISPECIES: hypothetical protein [unclassified Pseudomonas]PXX71835.1 hypothetical protein H160_02513 [Pseudomonas sp. LAMO17WK12:I9]SNY29271.1 hypothetical protein SAMN05660489_02428 [Pseudomonas sp. LAMO17WK12:I10]
MFTGKIPKEMPLKLLRAIDGMYLDKHGHGIRHLDEFFALATAHELFDQHIDGLFEVEGNVARPLLLDNFKELERKGYMRCEGGLKYFLTEAGYEQASKTKWQSFVDYWNSNPGLNTLVAILSAMIATVSLVVAIIALSNTGAPKPQSNQPGTETSQVLAAPQKAENSQPIQSQKK